MAGEYADRLRRSDFLVRDISLATCSRLVARHHYARRGANTATFRHGLFRRGDDETCLGVAWWIPPTRSAAEATYPDNWQGVLNLSRLVVVPGVPKNAAGFLLAQSIRRIRADHRWECLVTYADTGEGHVGTLYLATNWIFVGETAAEQRFRDRGGALISRKAGPTTYTRAEMDARGCVATGPTTKRKFIMLLPKRRSRQDKLDREPNLFKAIS